MFSTKIPNIVLSNWLIMYESDTTNAYYTPHGPVFCTRCSIPKKYVWTSSVVHRFRTWCWNCRPTRRSNIPANHKPNTKKKKKKRHTCPCQKDRSRKFLRLAPVPKPCSVEFRDTLRSEHGLHWVRCDIVTSRHLPS